MKIRNGFVSNSSSSSFLIKLGEEFPDVLSVAEHMINDKFDAWKDWDSENKYTEMHNMVESNVRKDIKRMRKHGDVNIPIFFQSTNYDTYIVLILDKYVYVDTCNNITWSITQSNSCTYNLPPELQELYPNTDLGDGGGELDRGKRKYDYYIIERGLMATPPEKYESCKKCYDEVWFIDGVKYCLNCDEEKITRGLKLSKLKKLIKAK